MAISHDIEVLTVKECLLQLLTCDDPKWLTVTSTEKYTGISP